MKKISILIIDEYQMVRDALAEILKYDHHYSFEPLTSDFENAQGWIKSQKPQVILLNINLEGPTGIEILKKISKLSGDSRIILIAEFKLPAYVHNILKMGVCGFVTKSSELSELKEAIDKVENGEKYICAELKDALADLYLNGDARKNYVDVLSKREIQILEKIKSGISSIDLALQLSLSPRTVDVHRYNIMRKLNVRNVASLVNLVNTYGF
jgi:DNA-binding NarL/FixJ family response regulator